MRSVVLSLAALLAFAGTVAAQTKPVDTNRGTTASSKKTPVGAKAPAPSKATNTNVQRAAAQQRFEQAWPVGCGEIELFKQAVEQDAGITAPAQGKAQRQLIAG